MISLVKIYVPELAQDRPDAFAGGQRVGALRTGAETVAGGRIPQLDLGISNGSFRERAWMALIEILPTYLLSHMVRRIDVQLGVGSHAEAEK
jgi:hypothetical protein